MDRCSVCMPLMMALVFMMSITVINLAEAQTDPGCIEQLSPCLNYVNSTNPPNICCNPVRDLYANQQNCFCKLLFTTGVLEGYGINITQALRLVHFCGVTVNSSICKVALSAPPPSPVPPPATPGGEEGGAGRVVFSGLLSFTLLFWAYALFN